jgi:hypothetical protein
MDVLYSTMTQDIQRARKVLCGLGDQLALSQFQRSSHFEFLVWFLFPPLKSFSVIGQGKNLFGDGIAMWVTQQSHYNAGDIHGSVEKFVGVGFVFDTFRNTERAGAHKDVTILINDGTKNLDDMTKVPMGCDAKFRYHANRADFSVANVTKVKVLIEDQR